MSLLAVFSLSAGCVPTRGFDSQLKSILEPYGFSIVGWELNTIAGEIRQLIFSEEGKIGDETVLVTEYFSLVEQIRTLKSEVKAINAGNEQNDPTTLGAHLDVLEEQRAALAEMVEVVLKKQIKETLAQLGIFNPIDKYIGFKVSFPPLNFKLEKPPYLLVISPRDRIESIREITLKQDTTLEEMEDIEAKVDKLGVSSLVVPLGGMASYPSFVTYNASLRFAIDTATEEWVHQYLTFTPLGFLYVLDITGVSQNYEIATMNETLASMVSKEVGSIMCEKYYDGREGGDNQAPATESEFDFNREMREIRRAVDRYLVQGEIEWAEEFMEQKQQYLASKGYYIRKLNQAYFAFYGTYADSPTSISSIGIELKELRNQSASLVNFLNTVAVMTSRHDLRESIK